MEPIRPLIKNDYAIVKLYLADNLGLPIEKPYRLKNGSNVFKCKAIYNDGSEDYFSPYWTCPILMRSGGLDVTGVLGDQKREEVIINASSNHQRYTELGCWVFPPKDTSQTGNSEIPHDITGFDYSQVS